MRKEKFEVDIIPDVENSLANVINALFETEKVSFLNNNDGDFMDVTFKNCGMAYDKFEISYSTKKNFGNNNKLNVITGKMSSVHVIKLNGPVCDTIFYKFTKHLACCIYAYTGYVLVNDVHIKQNNTIELTFLRNERTCEIITTAFRECQYFDEINDIYTKTRLLMNIADEVNNDFIAANAIECEFDANMAISWRLCYSRAYLALKIRSANKKFCTDYKAIIDADNTIKIVDIDRYNCLKSQNSIRRYASVSASNCAGMRTEMFAYADEFMKMLGYAPDAKQRCRNSRSYRHVNDNAAVMLNSETQMLEVNNLRIDDQPCYSAEFCMPQWLHNAFGHVCKSKYAIAASLAIAASAWIGYSMYSAHCANEAQRIEKMRAAYAALTK